MSASTNEPWYREGLKFACTQCGVCCSGEPGFVWVDDEEIAALAKFLNLDMVTFRDKFVRQVGERTSLLERPGGDCIFLDPESRGCTVYSARPVQCRTWPFWDSNLQSNRAWQETCRVCPGAGTGKLYGLQAIEESRKKKSV